MKCVDYPDNDAVVYCTQEEKEDHETKLDVVVPWAVSVMECEVFPTAGCIEFRREYYRFNVSRCSAAKHLAKLHRPEAVAALKEVAENTKEHWSVRVESVNALGAMRTNAARDTLAALLRNDLVLENHDFRAGLMTAAGIVC